MKFLYVLVCSEKDYYGEQALISMMSAKHHMPNCIISLLSDKTTDQYIANSKLPIDEYISEKKIIELGEDLSPTQKSRWLKTCMRELVKGDFLYVDVDTVFAGSIDESLFTKDVMGVPDGNCPLKEHPLKWQIEDNLKKLQFSNSLDYHINGGVLFLRDSPTAHSFANHWHKRWQESSSKGLFIDQPALHQAFIDSKLEQYLLPDYMNAQFGRNINTLIKGVILHYYSSWTTNPSYVPAYKFLQRSWLQNFRLDPKAETFKKEILNPKEAFDPYSIILNGQFNLFWHTRLIQHLMNLWLSSNRADKRLFKISETIVFKIKDLYYKLIEVLHPFYKVIKSIIH